MGYGNDRDVDARLERLERLVQQLVGGRGGGDFGDEDQDLGEDEFDEDEDDDSSEEQPSRFPDVDEDDFVPGVPGARHPGGSAYSSNARRAFTRYSRQTAAGMTFGSDVARFVAGQHISGDPIDRGRRAVSRFSRASR
jgi:hypothetical protein